MLYTTYYMITISNFSGEIKNDELTLNTFSKDASIFSIKPDTVVMPKTPEDVKSVVEYARAEIMSYH